MQSQRMGGMHSQLVCASCQRIESNKGSVVFPFQYFIVCDGNKPKGIYQVAYDIGNPKTRRREINGAVAAAKSTKCDNVFLLTDHQAETIAHEGVTIKVMPVWEWIVRGE